ncbi:hypothetical protein [Cetobacterium sp. ZWU0022]
MIFLVLFYLFSYKNNQDIHRKSLLGKKSVLHILCNFLH